MMRKCLIIILLVVLVSLAGAAEFTDYKVIAVSSPLINQIYANPELSDLEDVQLTPDSQIKLYENLSDDICKTLIDKFKDKITVICFSDIQSKLDDDTWDEFNRLFTGHDQVDTTFSRDIASKLKAGAVFDSYLMFNYYQDDKDKRRLEVHFEWYLVDLKSGESVLSDKYDCEDEFTGFPSSWEKEYHCFAGIVDSIASYKGAK